MMTGRPFRSPWKQNFFRRALLASSSLVLQSCRGKWLSWTCAWCRELVKPTLGIGTYPEMALITYSQLSPLCLWLAGNHGVWLIACRNVPDAVGWEYERWVLSSGCQINWGELRAQTAQGFLHLSPRSVVHFTRSVFRCVHLNLKSWHRVMVSSLFDFRFLLQHYVS